MTEQWVKWEPIKGLAPKYYINSVSDSIKGFEIILSESKNEKKGLRIFWQYSPDAYRSTNESYTNEIIVDLYNRYGRDFYGQWTFFKVENSEYLQWLSQKSSGISDYNKFTHYSILSSEYIMDIIDNSDPVVELIDL